VKVRDEITILPAVWRKHSCLRVHGTFQFRVPVPPGFGHRPRVPKELATGKSPLPADKNVGATERCRPRPQKRPSVAAAQVLSEPNLNTRL